MFAWERSAYFSYLGLQELAACKRVCRDWRASIKDRHLHQLVAPPEVGSTHTRTPAHPHTRTRVHPHAVHPHAARICIQARTHTHIAQADTSNTTWYRRVTNLSRLTTHFQFTFSCMPSSKIAESHGSRRPCCFHLTSQMLKVVCDVADFCWLRASSKSESHCSPVHDFFSESVTQLWPTTHPPPDVLPNPPTRPCLLSPL